MLKQILQTSIYKVNFNTALLFFINYHKENFQKFILSTMI